MDLQAIITRAWDDPEFKQALLSDPKGTLEMELGVQFPDEIEIYIHEQTPNALHLILPMKPEV